MRIKNFWLLLFYTTLLLILVIIKAEKILANAPYCSVSDVPVNGCYEWDCYVFNSSCGFCSECKEAAGVDECYVSEWQDPPDPWGNCTIHTSVTSYHKSSCSQGCGGGGTCFTPDTPISTPSGETQIKDLRVGNQVESYDPVTASKSTSIVEKIYEVTRSAYYKITLKDGKEIKVTAEHPLYAIKKEDKPLTFWQYLTTGSLTKKALDLLFSKL